MRINLPYLSSKHKRILFVLLAILFIVLIFFLKTKSVVKNAREEAGLAFGDETVASLLQKDTDLDGIADWEEALWETDPTKVDTDGDGISDNDEIMKLKATMDTGASTGGEEILTETDKFARTVFSTLVALNQAGVADEITLDNLSNKLVDEITNPSTTKTYSISDIKITQDNSLQGVKNYDFALTNLFKKYQKNSGNDGFLGILTSIYTVSVNALSQYFEHGEDDTVLNSLDPTIKEMKDIVTGMLKISAPSNLFTFHLDVINALQRVSENLAGLKLVNNDPVVAMGAVNKITENLDYLEKSFSNLIKAINQNY